MRIPRKHKPKLTLRLRRSFITGLLVILPLYISIYILIIIFKFTDGILGKFINVYFKQILGFYIPGLGIIIFVLAVLAVGFLSKVFVARALYSFIDRLISRFPVLRTIYPPLKQIFGFLFSENALAFKQAVLVEFPQKGSWTIGFVTNQSFKQAKEKTGRELLNVFVPLVPNPASGFIIFASQENLLFLDISIKEAMKLVLSGGLLNPTELPTQKL